MVRSVETESCVIPAGEGQPCFAESLRRKAGRYSRFVGFPAVQLHTNRARAGGGHWGVIRAVRDAPVTVWIARSEALD